MAIWSLSRLDSVLLILIEKTSKGLCSCLWSSTVFLGNLATNVAFLTFVFLISKLLPAKYQACFAALACDISLTGLRDVYHSCFQKQPHFTNTCSHFRWQPRRVYEVRFAAHSYYRVINFASVLASCLTSVSLFPVCYNE